MHLQRFWALCGLLAALVSAPTLAFDHDYGDYGALLTEHVQLSDDRTRGSVDYAGLQQNRARLDALLEDWSAVSQKTFDGWSRDQQMAFLINAYNGFTLALILTEYPDLKSIRDLGSLFRSAWKIEFFSLLGKNGTWTGSSTTPCAPTTPTRASTLPSIARRWVARRCSPAVYRRTVVDAARHRHTAVSAGSRAQSLRRRERHFARHTPAGLVR